MARADDDLGPLFIILTAVLTALSVTTICMRWSARLAKRALGWDDYTMTVAVVFTLPRLVLQVMSVGYGNGKHVEALTTSDYQTINKLGWATQIILFPCTALVKVSICLLCLRIKTTRTLKRLLSVVMVGIVIFNFIPWIILLSECRPISAYWRPSDGKCWNPKIRTSVIYMTIDIICTTLPMVAVWGLQIARIKKLLVCGLVGLGLTATCCASGRAWSLSLDLKDLSWTYCIAAIWSNCELHVSIIASNLTCAPAFINMIKNFIRPPPPSYAHSSYGNRYGSGRGTNTVSDLDTTDTFREQSYQLKTSDNIQANGPRTWSTVSIDNSYPEPDDDTAIMITRRFDRKNMLVTQEQGSTTEMDSLPSRKSSEGHGKGQ
ncbi:hypothetical protein CAC42_4224 [Sphaceloma murrayae]|uniref:Rhodopsin domain-containing protein n=1 Tax=Sphaceloma murrayae TaxID=2082308 RepID=A0A2K1QLD3_9PEZI|nr:hypothetical protein CAC42_4224 [Sphaceloma murrayae]